MKNNIQIVEAAIPLHTSKSGTVQALLTTQRKDIIGNVNGIHLANH